MFKLIDGKAVADTVKEEVKKQVAALKSRGVSVGLAVILVGDDEASKIYVKRKQSVCEELGIRSFEYNLDSGVTEAELVALIEKLNKDPEINGILCQLPLPSHIDKSAIIGAIDISKDVDGFHPVNTGKMLVGTPGVLPCTPAGILKLLDYYGISVAGKKCVVIGRSDIVGKPVASLLMQRDGTVTVCHSKTPDLKEETKTADILVSATGQAGLVTADMVKEGAVIIDVGISRKNGKLCGDVDFEKVKEKAAYITPVPGGVGPMTIAMLMYNTLAAAKKQSGITL